MFQFPQVLMDDPSLGSTSTKCTEEKVPTEHLYVKIEPLDLEGQAFPSPEQAMELLAKTKRLMICTSCGNLRLTN